jgi:hypothetical protein
MCTASRSVYSASLCFCHSQILGGYPLQTALEWRLRAHLSTESAQLGDYETQRLKWDYSDIRRGDARDVPVIRAALRPDGVVSEARFFLPHARPARDPVAGREVLLFDHRCLDGARSTVRSVAALAPVGVLLSAFCPGLRRLRGPDQDFCHHAPRTAGQNAPSTAVTCPIWTARPNDVQLAIDQGCRRFNALMASAASDPRTKRRSAHLPDMRESPNRAQIPPPVHLKKEPRPRIERAHPTRPVFAARTPHRPRTVTERHWR